MKKTSSSNELLRYTSQLYLGMFAGLLLLSALASLIGFAGNLFELTFILMFSLMSSSFCMWASENC